jgi:Ca-activated chloride channel homolog
MSVKQYFLIIGFILLYFPLKAESIEELFKKGNKLYREEQFEAAIKQYATILSANNIDPNTKADAFYNMGNAYAKWGKWELAVGAYSNALMHKPGFALAQYNLTYARTKLPPPNKQTNNKDQEDKSKAPPPNKSNMDKQNAEQILKALREQEKRIKREARRPNGQGATYNQKNW